MGSAGVDQNEDLPPHQEVPASPSRRRPAPLILEGAGQRESARRISKGMSQWSVSNRDGMASQGEADPCSTPRAGSKNNSRRHSRIIDASGLGKADNVNLDEVLAIEKQRSRSQVSSRGYNDDVVEGAAAKLRKSITSQSLAARISVESPCEQISPASLIEALHQVDNVFHRLVSFGLTLVISVVICLQYAGLAILSKFIHEQRLQWLQSNFQSMGAAYAFAFHLFPALPIIVCVAFVVTTRAPRAAGSGVSDIKAFLNGNSIPELFSLKTLLVRAFGLMLVTSSGLLAGFEDPIGHLGASTALFLARPVYESRLEDRLPFFGHRLSCEQVLRGFATGIACGFGSPLGGVLFALEEASSYWSKGLTWHAFLSSVLAAAIGSAATVGFQRMPSGGFVQFPDLADHYELWELVPFILIAMTTGLLASLLGSLTALLSKFRSQIGRCWFHRKNGVFRSLEVTLVLIITVSCCIWLPLLDGCQPLAPGQQNTSIGGLEVKQLRGILCPEGQYSDLAVLLLQTPLQAIETLFSLSFAGGAFLRTSRLMVTMTVAFMLTLITHDTALPAGLWTPNALIGATLGRAVGQTIQSLGYDIHPGMYALIGSVGMLVGSTRMTVSVAVIALQMTNSTLLVLPITVCILVSKSVADQLSQSIYDLGTTLHSLGSLPMLRSQLDEEELPLLRLLSVHDACTVDVMTLRTAETRGHILAVLMQTKYSGYPVVAPGNQVVGLVLREQLLDVLREQGAAHGFLNVFGGSGTVQPDSSHLDDQMLDLQMLCERTPEVKHWNTPLAKAYCHFVATGLRHLCIVDETNRLVGILTRSDLSPICHPRTQKRALALLLARKRECCSDEEEHEQSADASEAGSEVGTPRSLMRHHSWLY